MKNPWEVNRKRREGQRVRGRLFFTENDWCSEEALQAKDLFGVFEDRIGKAVSLFDPDVLVKRIFGLPYADIFFRRHRVGHPREVSPPVDGYHPH
jgi:hypothetical protein